MRARNILALGAAASLMALVGCGKFKVETVHGVGVVTAEHLTMEYVETIDATGNHNDNKPRLSKYGISVKVGNDTYNINVGYNNNRLWCGRDAERKTPRQLESEINVGDIVQFPLYNKVTSSRGEKYKQETPEWIQWEEHLYESDLPVCMISILKKAD